MDHDLNTIQNVFTYLESFYYENLNDDTLPLLGYWSNQDGVQDGHHKGLIL